MSGVEMVKVACAQMQPAFGMTRANLDKIAKMSTAAGADLVVFPELATSGYEFIDRRELSRLALDVKNGSEFELLKTLAADVDSHIVLGFPEIDGDRLYNSAALIEPAGEVTLYRKIHLFDREKNLFDPGDGMFRVKDTEVGRIGIMICFDWIFPEAARLLAIGGAQIICHPSNLVLSYCQQAMFARSVENGVFTMTCNRIGTESRTDRDLTFTGGSQVLSNRGSLLAQAGVNSEEIIATEINPLESDDKRLTPNNDILKDRRPSLYGGLV